MPEPYRGLNAALAKAAAPDAGTDVEAVLTAALHSAVCGDPEVCCWTEDGGSCADNAPLGIEASIATALAEAGIGSLAQARAEGAQAVVDAVRGYHPAGPSPRALMGEFCHTCGQPAPCPTLRAARAAAQQAATDTGAQQGEGA